LITFIQCAAKATSKLRSEAPAAPWPVLALVGVLLAGCQAVPSAIWQTAQLALAQPAPRPPSVPGVDFLRVVSPSGVAFMALGEREAAPAPWGGPALAAQAAAESAPPVASALLADAEVWYSASRQVLRLEAGRLASTAGLPVDWKEVRTTLKPAWSEAALRPQTYWRTRDVMPGQRRGIVERVTVQRADQLPPGWKAAEHLSSENWIWFVEKAQLVGPQRRTPEVLGQNEGLPDAWFAVESLPQGEVVYSRQCLSAGLCLGIKPFRARRP